MDVETDFASWLTDQLNERGWSNSELARRAEVVPSTVSMVLSRQNQPGLDFCVGVARALHIPPEVVLRKAGLIPTPPEENEVVSEIVYVLYRLSPDDQQRVLVQIRALHDLSQREKYTVREPGS